jgi:hypothetical protein
MHLEANMAGVFHSIFNSTQSFHFFLGLGSWWPPESPATLFRFSYPTLSLLAMGSWGDQVLQLCSWREPHV